MIQQMSSVNDEKQIDSFSETVENLFTQYSIAELRKIEFKLVSDIEKKKQELRFVVGEKYRDLIDAADSIQSMKESIQDMSSEFTKLLDMTKTQFDFESENRQKLQEKQSKSQNYSIAAQIKLLVGSSEQIWTCIENHQFLKASIQFLLAKVVYKHVSSETTFNMKTFPVVHRLWDAIQPLKHQILTHSMQYIKNFETPDEMIIHTLVAMMLLNLSSPSQALELFVRERTETIKNNIVINYSIQDTVKRLTKCIEEILQGICTTIHQVCFALTSKSDNILLATELLHNTSNVALHHNKQRINVLSTNEAEHSIFRYLPSSVHQYIPYLNKGDLSSDQFYEETKIRMHHWFLDMKHWLCSELIPTTLSLEKVSFDDLLEVRLQVFKIIDDNIEQSAAWTNPKFKSFLPTDLPSFWKNYLDQVFAAQVNEHMSYAFKNSISMYLMQIQQKIQIPNVPSSKSINTLPALFYHAIKRKTIPRQLSNELFNSLKHLGALAEKHLMNSHFEKFQDTSQFVTHYDQVTTEWVKSLLEGLASLLQENPGNAHFLCAFTQSIYQDINQCLAVFIPNMNQQTSLKHEQKIMSMFKSKRQQVMNMPSDKSGAFQYFKSEIVKLHSKVNETWINQLLKSLEHEIEAIQQSNMTFESMSDDNTSWLSFTIASVEEAAPESILLPVAPSSMIISIMAKLTENIYKIIGFSLDEIMKEQLQVLLSSFIYTLYEKAVTNSKDMSAQLAMQLYFDLICCSYWFENGLSKRKDIKAKHDKLMEFALEKMDAIDFAIGKSQLLENVGKYQLSTHMLFSMYIREIPKTKSLPTIDSSSLSSVVSMVQQPCRFALIPLSPEDTIFDTKKSDLQDKMKTLKRPFPLKEIENENDFQKSTSNQSKPKFTPSINIRLKPEQYSSIHSSSTGSPSRSTRLDSSATFSSFAASLLSNSPSVGSPQISSFSPSSSSKGKHELFSVASSLLSNVFTSGSTSNSMDDVRSSVKLNLSKRGDDATRKD